MSTGIAEPAPNFAPSRNKTLSAILVKREGAFDVTCPQCQSVIFRAPDQRTAYCNTGKIAEHAAACVGGPIAR
jgi:hypothetical protein